MDIDTLSFTLVCSSISASLFKTLKILHCDVGILSDFSHLLCIFQWTPVGKWRAGDIIFKSVDAMFVHAIVVSAHVISDSEK